MATKAKTPATKKATTTPSAASVTSAPIVVSAPIGNAADVEHLGNGIHWVGLRDKDPFHLNPYLIIDGDDAVLLDPGGLMTAAAVFARVKGLIDPKKIRYIVAHHQDPDVCSAVNFFRPHVAPDCKIVCHSRMSVLIKHFGAGFEFLEVDRNNWQLTFGGGRVLTFAHTPYLHSPGAIVTYDKRSQTAFTSDLFGGITPEWNLFASEKTADELESFHIGYMPSTDILHHGLRQIEALGPIRRLAPQHGSIIDGDLVERFFAHMKKIQVGMFADDLFKDRIVEQNQANRMRQMVENANVNFMAADENGKIVYINPAARQMFLEIESSMPCKVDEMVGKSYDIFHKNPQHQRHIMQGHSNMLPRSTRIQFGPYYLLISAFGVYDSEGKFQGPGVVWENVTEQTKLEQRDAEVKRSAVAMTEELTASSDHLRNVSLNMSSVAEETSAQANTVSDASVNVASNINTVVSSVKEMTLAINEISANASKSSTVAHHAVNLAKIANTKVTELDTSSKEIGKVTRVISDIAQQTNLLALNATIEAARAGEMGRGFAVVANSIKDLAKQTRASTEDITEKIEKIQEVTKSATESIREITEIIGQINDISSSIASSVEEQSAVSGEISNNMQAAAQGVGEISSNVSTVADAANGTSKGATDTRVSAEQLAELSQRLSNLVKDF